MDCIDLVKFARAFKNRTVPQVELYGRIVSRVPRPDNLPNDLKIKSNGMFVEMQVFAVNLSKYAQYLKGNGYSSIDYIYMVNGSVVTYIEQNKYKLPDWYKIFGTLAIASDTNYNIMSMFKWVKHDGNWAIDNIFLDNIQLSIFDNNESISIWANKCLQTDEMQHPEYIKNLTKFNSHKIVLNEGYKGLDNTLSEAINNQDVNSYNTVVSSSSFKKESRQDIKEFSSVYDDYKTKLDDSDIKRNNYIQNLIKSYKDDGSITDYVRYTIDALALNLKHKPMDSAYTGRAVLKIYLNNFGKIAKENYMGTTVADFLADDFREIAEFMKSGNESIINCDGKAWSLCKSAFYNPEAFYAGIISSILSVKYDDIMEIQTICENNGISFSKLINENAYALQVMSNLSYKTIDYLALCFGQSYATNLDTDRNIAILHSYISDKNDGSTVFEIDSLKHKHIGNKITVNMYDSCKTRGSFLSQANIANILTYISNSRDLRYDISGYTKFGNYNYIKSMSSAELNKAIDDYVNSGLGVKIDKYITSCYLLNKELSIYDFAYNLGKQKNGYDHAEIDRLIDKYEVEEVGFKLEPEQRQAVHLIDNRGAIIAGSAGSGKTTISNCMVYVLNHLNDSLDIKFSAPTGKAAKRMQEVVKQEVKTLNSRFKVFDTSNKLFDASDEDGIDDNDVVHMFDEGAMITTDLLYSTFKKMSDSDSLYLFGDFHQLSPIGKGLPFKDLLRFMPCQFLNVSKRAAEGSSITYNSDIVNNYSEYNNWKELKEGDDFIPVSCSNDDIAKCVKDICSYYLGKSDASILKNKWGIKNLPHIDGLTPDDIQVVSPLAKATYVWGATRLNTMLQPLFNPVRDYSKTFVYQTNEKNYTKFVIGDRVIHTDSNMYSMQWYSTYKNGVFRKRYGFGICNGEVGKVVAFISTDSCIFEDEDVSTMPDDFQYPNNLRDDSKYSERDSYFVVVEYYDYLSQSNFYILYRCKQTTFDCGVGKSLNGDDLAKLMLFYAGTTHKLQGSQAKLIICALGSVDYKKFITRNMIYTMMTRAEKLEFIVGSVGNERGSMLSNARRDVASTDTLTVGEIL